MVALTEAVQTTLIVTGGTVLVSVMGVVGIYVQRGASAAKKVEQAVGTPNGHGNIAEMAAKTLDALSRLEDRFLRHDERMDRHDHRMDRMERRLDEHLATHGAHAE